jgi:hypothetical protein
MKVYEDDFGKKLQEALGLTGRQIREIHIHVVADDIILIDTVEYLTNNQTEPLLELLKHYHLEENKPYNCPCLEIAGQLNYSTYGIPISDCQTCHGTGYIKENEDGTSEKDIEKG